ncbi:MAG: right-handed parallel beta-helix repeat-containing protein, partial [Thermoplasmata archaeon]
MFPPPFRVEEEKMLRPKKGLGRIICASLALLLVIASLSITSAGENDIVTISGTVYLPDGTTPANATEVAAMNVRTEELDTTHTDEDGHYSLSVPALQDDMLKFAATRGFEYDKHTIEVSEVTSPYDITLKIQKPGTSPTPVEPLDVPEDDPFTIDIPTVKEVREATDNGTDVIEIPHYNVTVSNLLIKDGVAVYNQREWVQIFLKNIGDIKTFQVTVDISVIEEGQVRSLKYLHYGALQPGMEKERRIRWTPKVKEDCTIVLDIEYMENHPVKGNRVNYTEEIGVAVADEEPGTPETSSPWLIDGPVVMDGWYLSLKEDIVITSTGHLKMINGAELILECRDNGEFSITLQEGGRFDIWGKSELKSSVELNNFRFHNYGRLDVNRSTVKWTYGDSNDLSNPGGIQCFSTSTTTIRNSTIKEGYTHNIYVEDCSPSITNSNVTFAGSAAEGGYGIYATGNSQPEIMHSNISDNKKHGIHFENIQNPVSPPWPPETIQATSH